MQYRLRLSAMRNAEVMAAVVAKWAAPAARQLLVKRLDSMGWVQTLTNWGVNSGLVPVGWSAASEIAPLLSDLSEESIRCIVLPMFDGVPDAALPHLAHDVLKSAAQRGEFSLMGGAITLERKDIVELMRLVQLNMPVESAEKIEIKV